MVHLKLLFRWGVGGGGGYWMTGFVQVMENLESPGILLWHFPGLESPKMGFPAPTY